MEVVPFASTSATGQHVQIAMENATYVSTTTRDTHAKYVLAMGCVFTCVKSIHVMNAVAHHVAHMEGGNNNVVTAQEVHFASTTGIKSDAKNVVENMFASMKAVISPQESLECNAKHVLHWLSSVLG